MSSWNSPDNPYRSPNPEHIRAAEPAQSTPDTNKPEEYAGSPEAMRNETAEEAGRIDSHAEELRRIFSQKTFQSVDMQLALLIGIECGRIRSALYLRRRHAEVNGTEYIGYNARRLERNADELAQEYADIRNEIHLLIERIETLALNPLAEKNSGKPSEPP